MSREELNNRIEKYLDGELTVEEKKLLELLIASDDKVEHELEFHVQLRNGIIESNKREALKNKIKDWDNQSKIITPKQSSRLWRPILAAASISLLITICGVALYHITFRNKIDGNLKDDIAELSREIEKNNQETNALIQTESNKIKAIEKDVAVTKKTNLAGTAFMLSNDGYLITNYHIVRDGLGVKKQVTIEQQGEENISYKAEVVATNPKLDFALLKINDNSFKTYPKIPYSVSDKTVSLAQKIYTLGYPKNDIVYTEGAISSLSGLKNDTMFYQLNIISAPGSSGSPIINDKGELVGVLASRNAQAEGQTYCVKMKYVLNYINDLQKKDKSISIKTNIRSNLSGKKLTDQVKTVMPFVFIVKA